MMKRKDANELWFVFREGPTLPMHARLHGLRTSTTREGKVLEFVEREGGYGRQVGMTFSEAEAHATKQKALYPENRYHLVKAMFEVVPATGYTLKDLD